MLKRQHVTWIELKPCMDDNVCRGQQFPVTAYVTYILSESYEDMYLDRIIILEILNDNMGDEVVAFYPNQFKTFGN